MITAIFYRSHTSWKCIFLRSININLKRWKLTSSLVVYMMAYYAFSESDELLCWRNWSNHKVTVVLSGAWSNRACRKAWSMVICSVINPDLTCRAADTCRRLNGVAKYAIRVFCNCLWPQLSVLLWTCLVQEHLKGNYRIGNSKTGSRICSVKLAWIITVIAELLEMTVHVFVQNRQLITPSSPAEKFWSITRENNLNLERCCLVTNPAIMLRKWAQLSCSEMKTLLLTACCHTQGGKCTLPLQFKYAGEKNWITTNKKSHTVWKDEWLLIHEGIRFNLTRCTV